MFDLLAGLALGYILGSLPSAALIARLRGHDIYAVGSGNPGAMNTARNIGYGWGALVLLLDVAKGAAAVLLAQWLAGAAALPDGRGLAMEVSAGVGAVAGHAWPAFTGFRGGKALATTLGASLALYPLAGLLAVGILVSLVLMVRRVALAAVLTMAAYPLAALALFARQGLEQERGFAIVTGLIAIGVIVIVKHVPSLRSEKRAF